MKKSIIAVILIILFVMIFETNNTDKDISEKDEFAKSCVMFPVVNNTEGGRVLEACARVVPGEGYIFMNINNTKIDEYKSQAAIVKGVEAAYNASGRSRENEDVIIYINSGGTIIRGDSMGVAVAVAVFARINNVEIRDDISVTGAIRRDGSIGNVSSVKDKAIASNAYGMQTMTVPVGRKIFNGTNIQDITGIQIIETKDINEVIGILSR